MPPESSAATKKHVTTACTFCRARKIKCDGSQPVCFNCEVNSRICEYNRWDDKRKVSPKKTINYLTARVKQLERTLEEQGIEIPPPDTDEKWPSGSTGAGDNAHQNSLRRTSTISNPIPERAGSLDEPLVKTDDSPSANQGSGQHESPWMPSQPHLTPSAAAETSSASDGDSMTDDLAAQMGSLKIAEDGQLRYYGPTSNLHIVHNGLFSLSRSTIRSVSEEGVGVLQRAGVGQHVDPEVELHLIKLYFAWEDPSIHVVDEEMFYVEREKWISGTTGTPFYSETLTNAICAVGACMSLDVKLGVPEPASEFFSARAKALLEVEMDSPTVATVQALVVMSATEAAFTRDARGWLYSGMAVRLSADLGLHLDLTNHVRNGMLTKWELEVRRTTFWGVFIHDNMWSLYVGRPWGISIRDISVSRPPKGIDSVRMKTWSPYGNNQEYSKSAIEMPLIDPVEACADANVSLAEFMRRISRTLYAGRRIPVAELLSFASDTRKNFANWLETLPELLHVDLTGQQQRLYLPHVLQLHMQFYALSIFLHRPYFSRHLLRGTELSSSAQTTEAATARRHCIAAAQSLVEVLKIYRKQHTLRQTNVQLVHLVFTAGLTHVYHACTSTGPETVKAMDDLQVCCQALGDIGQAWRNATRALETIICIKREWQNKAAAYAASTKRPGSSIEGNDAEHHRRRRQRTSDSVPSVSPPVQPAAFENLVQNNEMYDAWQFLNVPGVNFGMGNEVFTAGEDDLMMLMGGFDPADDPFAFGMLQNSTFNDGQE